MAMASVFCSKGKVFANATLNCKFEGSALDAICSSRVASPSGAGDDPICRGGRHNRSNRWLESDRKEAPVFHRDVKGGIAVPELLPSRRAAAEA
jgi:hypothetical protein